MVHKLLKYIELVFSSIFRYLENFRADSANMIHIEFTFSNFLNPVFRSFGFIYLSIQQVGKSLKIFLIDYFIICAFLSLIKQQRN